MATIDVKTEITGIVWKVLKQEGDRVEEEEPILILESMKMEIPVPSPEIASVAKVLVEEGDTVTTWLGSRCEGLRGVASSCR